ncbi:preprotein translocase subunit SecA [Schaalia sp. Marseille-Q2122]|uniref:preprotein translocase subunit SecA n=1 Tax=Schaalia sp. Marseille-Q2122 TaxID=2736604 RepID=UPI00158A3C26|nr:preprotein translocase subunit SecA [Schaalia sp. Marseille-Q2122]
MSFIDKILRAGEGRTLKKLDRIAQQVDALREDFEALTDEELRAKTAEFKQRLSEGETLDDLMVEAFATVREAAWRTLRQRPFHVQVMGAAALHLGNIAEMKTGEGKTLVATMPSYLRSLTGDGVHVVTVNDYLAKYQSDLMARVFNFLDVSVGCILVGQSPEERRKQYNADITYGTNNEFGFDYLRDNMAQRVEDMVQRGHHYVIVDEVDSILIDEARTPLIISGPATGDVNRWYTEFARIVRGLEAGVDYEVDEKKKTIGVLEPGIDKVEDELGVENLYEAANTPLIGFLNNAIRAKELFHRDHDYIIADGEVLIVDEHTGRSLPGRRYNEGMHQAIEAKEGVEIKAENQTLASITLQNYFRLYPEGSRAGMTGTAETEAAEFVSTYKIGVVPIPTNKPVQRIDQPDYVYPTLQGKLNAIVDDIAERHAAGQPVLVGTASVESSELVSEMLKKRRIPHQVLNAKQHAREAQVVAMAGRKGAVTVATNMAGRGTDIMLGGNSEFIAQANLAHRGLDPKLDPEGYRAAWPEALAEADAAVQAEREEVCELGGLYVLGTERHESRRIDNQLRGRSGRQGDPGESRFYLSMQDDLMRLYSSGLAQRIMASGAYPEDMPLESKIVSRSIASAQSQVEGRNFEIRKNVLKYDDVMTGQRELIYEERRRILEGEDMHDQLLGFMELMIAGLVKEKTADLSPREWDLDELWDTLRAYYPPSVTYQEVEDAHGGPGSLVREELINELVGDIKSVYADAEDRLSQNPIAIQQLGEDPMRTLEQRVVIGTVDRLWREHLYEMDYLKEGIGLRAMGQRDPLVEYRDEAAKMFNIMMERIREESVQAVFAYTRQFDLVYEQAVEAALAEQRQAEQNAAQAEKNAQAAARPAEVSAAKARAVMGDLGREKRTERLQYSAPSDTGANSGMNRAQRRAAKKGRK